MGAYDRIYTRTLRPMSSHARADLAIQLLLDAAAGKRVPFGDDPPRAVLGTRAWDNLFEAGDGASVAQRVQFAAATRPVVARAVLHENCRRHAWPKLLQHAENGLAAAQAATPGAQLALL